MTKPLLNWPAIAELPWRQRNAHIERALRTHLTPLPRGYKISTHELAWLMLYPDDEYVADKNQPVGKLAQTLAKMAPHMGPLATHDGDEIKRYGKTWRRWNWRGQGNA